MCAVLCIYIYCCVVKLESVVGAIISYIYIYIFFQLYLATLDRSGVGSETHTNVCTFAQFTFYYKDTNTNKC